MSDEGTTAGAPQPAAVDVRITAGHPSDEEIAAITAVLAALAEQRAAAGEEAVVPPPSAWERSRRGIRAPIEVGPGRWRQFSG